MENCMKNESPTSDKEKQGPMSPGGDDQNFVEFSGNKPNGEKHSSDGKGHWSGH